MSQTKTGATPFRFTWMEFSGSLGDLGLFIPLVVAITVALDLNIGIILIFAGLMNVVTGWIFRQPIPVQPMKALAAIAITEGLLKEELFAAGIILGVALIVLSIFINSINAYVPKTVIRGIQLGIGLKLALKGVLWIKELPMVGIDSVSTAIVITGLLLFFIVKSKPGLIFIFAIGFVLLYFSQGEIYQSLAFSWPSFMLYVPAQEAWLGGFLKGALPQLPLTVLNSVIAVCALSRDYFPGRGISPKRMAVSVGLMNLICVPFGALPMCHGSGGLAAQYRFGARTGASVMMLGALKILVGLFLGAALLTLLQNYPISVLAPMLIFAGLQLAKSAKDSFSCKRESSIVLVTAILILSINTLIGFLVGMGLTIFYRVIQREV